MTGTDVGLPLPVQSAQDPMLDASKVWQDPTTTQDLTDPETRVRAMVAARQRFYTTQEAGKVTVPMDPATTQARVLDELTGRMRDPLARDDFRTYITTGARTHGVAAWMGEAPPDDPKDPAYWLNQPGQEKGFVRDFILEPFTRVAIGAVQSGYDFARLGGGLVGLTLPQIDAYANAAASFRKLGGDPKSIDTLVAEEKASLQAYESQRTRGEAFAQGTGTVIGNILSMKFNPALAAGGEAGGFASKVLFGIGKDPTFWDRALLAAGRGAGAFGTYGFLQPQEVAGELPTMQERAAGAAGSAALGAVFGLAEMGGRAAFLNLMRGAGRDGEQLAEVTAKWAKDQGYAPLEGEPQQDFMKRSLDAWIQAGTPGLKGLGIEARRATAYGAQALIEAAGLTALDTHFLRDLTAGWIGQDPDGFIKAADDYLTNALGMWLLHTSGHSDKIPLAQRQAAPERPAGPEFALHRESGIPLLPDSSADIGRYGWLPRLGEPPPEAPLPTGGEPTPLLPVPAGRRFGLSDFPAEAGMHYDVTGDVARPSAELQRALGLPAEMPVDTFLPRLEKASLISALQSKGTLPGYEVMTDGIHGDADTLRTVRFGVTYQRPATVAGTWLPAPPGPANDRPRDAIKPAQQDAADKAAISGRQRLDLPAEDRPLLAAIVDTLHRVSAERDRSIAEALPFVKQMTEALRTGTTQEASAAIKQAAEVMTTKSSETVRDEQRAREQIAKIPDAAEKATVQALAEEKARGKAAAALPRPTAKEAKFARLEKAAIERANRANAARKSYFAEPTPEEDMLTWIAKKGGINSAEAYKFDKTFKDYSSARIGIRPIFTKGGMSLAHAEEMLAAAGFPVGTGKYKTSDVTDNLQHVPLTEVLLDALGGSKIHPQGSQDWIDKETTAHLKAEAAREEDQRDAENFIQVFGQDIPESELHEYDPIRRSIAELSLALGDRADTIREDAAARDLTDEQTLDALRRAVEEQAGRGGTGHEDAAAPQSTASEGGQGAAGAQKTAQPVAGATPDEPLGPSEEQTMHSLTAAGLPAELAVAAVLAKPVWHYIADPILSKFSDSLIRRAELAGAPRNVIDLLNRANTASKGLRTRFVQKGLNDYLEMARYKVFGRNTPEMRSLTRLVTDKHGNQTTVWYAANDEHTGQHFGIDAVAMPEKARAIVDLAHTLIVEGAKIAAENKIRFQNAEGGLTGDPNLYRVPRKLTDAGRAAYNDASSKERAAFVDALEKLGYTPKEIEAGIGGVQSLVRHDSTEYARGFKVLPSRIPGPGPKGMMQLYEDHPFDTIERVVRDAYQILGARSVFNEQPEETAGTPGEAPRLPAPFQDVPEGARKMLVDMAKTSSPQAVQATKDAVRALFGLPVYSDGRYHPPANVALRIGAALINAYKANKLALAALSHVGQLLPTAPATLFFGPTTWTKALANTFGKLLSFQLTDERERLARAGFLTRQIKSRQVAGESGLETFENVVEGFAAAITSPLHGAVSLIETATASAAESRLDAMRNGEGTSADRSALTALDFKPDQIERMLKGDGTAEEYERYRSGIVGRISSMAGETPADKPISTHHKGFNFVLWFQGFFRKSTKQFRSLLQEYNDAKTQADRGIAIGKLATFVVLSSVASFVAQLAKKHLKEGTGYADLVRELANDPVALFRTMATSAMFGPLPEILFQGASAAFEGGTRGQVVESFARFIPIVDAATDASLFVAALANNSDEKAIAGYEGKTFMEKVGHFLGTANPLLGDVNRGLFGIGALAIASRPPKLANAADALMRWRRANFLPTTPDPEQPEQVKWLNAMRKVIDQVEAGGDWGDDKLMAAMDRADLFGKNAESVASSLRAHRFLVGPLDEASKASFDEKQWASARAFVGAKNWAVLEDHDAILNFMAQRWMAAHGKAR